MKVYHNGFNLHRQFPSAENIVENFIDHVYHDLSDIEVSYQFVVLLVADVVVIQGAKTQTLNFDQEIVQVSCDEAKILVLLRNGDLMKITDNICRVPRFGEMEESDRIIRISSGSKLTVALTGLGSLYNGPNKLEFDGKDIVDVKTGREHCILLNKTGEVFSFGRGSRGQLGHGSLEDETEPRFVEALGGVRMQAVAAGGWHSCALSQDGDVYIWGWNGSGQLGSGENQPAVLATPQVLDLDFNINQIGCGNKHTVFLSDTGKLYGCGWNKYKQLKGEDKEIFWEVSYLGDFSKEVVMGLKCGPWNTVVLCKDEMKRA